MISLSWKKTQFALGKPDIYIQEEEIMSVSPLVLNPEVKAALDAGF